MSAIKLERRFGKCPERRCKTRRVVDGGSFVDGISIHYRGNNRDELRTIGAWCDEHNRHLVWDQLKATINPDKVCNEVCMAATGPSCSCSCGGENHGRNYV